MKPATSSDSASARSKGGRFVSASAEMKNTRTSGRAAASTSRTGRLRVLRLDDRREIERADAEQHGDDHEADRDLVGDHLRRRAQRAEERVLRVRSPTAHDDAVHAERGDREDVEDADIDVGDRPAFRDRDHRPGRQREHAGDQRRQQEHALVGARRDDRLLEDELQQVGEALQQAEGADHVRAAAQLHRRPDLAVGEQDEGDEDQQADQQQQALAGDDQRGRGRGPSSSEAYSAAWRMRPEASAEHSAITAEARAIGFVV
jgi:hypothetical protein